MTGRIAAIADSLFAARLGALAIEPPSQTMGLVDAAEAYAVQRHNSRRRREAGDVEVGRKHPSTNGHRYLAERLAAALDELRTAPVTEAGGSESTPDE